MFPFSREGSEPSTLLGSLERANLSHWKHYPYMQGTFYFSFILKTNTLDGNSLVLLMSSTH
jgi:hypothetical protein